MPKQRVVITILGGLVNGIFADDPAAVEVAVIDYDTHDDIEDLVAEIGFVENATPLAQADTATQLIVDRIFGETVEA